MRLLPVFELQPVLDPAEKFVGTVEFVKILAADVIFVVQFLQREQSTAGAQPGLLSAIDPLQTLHQELDIANAAAVYFNVDALLGFVDRTVELPSRADLLA